MTERELYGVITAAYYQAGAEDHWLAFMSGAKGYQTRDARSSDYAFERGHFAKVDGGACYKGYQVDLCRHIGLAPLEDSQRLAMLASKRAVAAALGVIGAGVPISALGSAADAVLRQAGFTYYMNSVGHGVGMDMHEPPWLERKNDAPVHPGMVLSVEIGVVNPDRWDDGSCTFEDNIVVEENGCRVLSDKFSEELYEV